MPHLVPEFSYIWRLKMLQINFGGERMYDIGFMYIELKKPSNGECDHPFPSLFLGSFFSVKHVSSHTQFSRIALTSVSVPARSGISSTRKRVSVRSVSYQSDCHLHDQTCFEQIFQKCESHCIESLDKLG